MEEFKGTKGKFKNGFKGWKAVEYSNKVGFSTHEIHYSDDGECVAEVVHGEENAKLIASAPELLEAMLYLRDCMESWSDIHNDVREKIEKAIQKAVG